MGQEGRSGRKGPQTCVHQSLTDSKTSSVSPQALAPRPVVVITSWRKSPQEPVGDTVGLSNRAKSGIDARSLYLLAIKSHNIRKGFALEVDTTGETRPNTPAPNTLLDKPELLARNPW